jgi:Legionella pneumophila major outer membrane protein precursor
MRGKSSWGAWLLGVGLALTPGIALAEDPVSQAANLIGLTPIDGVRFPTVRGQLDAGSDGPGSGMTGYAPADPQLPVPLGSTHIDQGGFYLYTQYVMFHQTNPLHEQQVAVRGVLATDDTVPGTAPLSSGQFIGSRTEAFNVKQVNGPTTYQPGFQVGMGWKFQDGSTLSLDWLYLSETKYTAAATFAKAGFTFRPDLADQFLFANVYNFPPEFAGPPGRIAGASNFALLGIWDGADVMTEAFVQRFEQWQFTYRKPVYDTENYRLSGYTGPRFVWIWERYTWLTHAAPSVQGNDSGSDAMNTAIYTNIDSNRMYGVFVGCSQEWYLGRGFACQLDTDAAIFLDSVKERQKYELAVKFSGAENKRAGRQFTIAPEVAANLNIMWYPTEFVQVRVGYNVMAFFNTLSSPQPIDFDYSRLTAPYESTFRLFDGFNAGVSIIF